MVYTWLPQAVVKGIALGEIDPLTKEPFEVLSVSFRAVLVIFFYKIFMSIYICGKFMLAFSHMLYYFLVLVYWCFVPSNVIHLTLLRSFVHVKECVQLCTNEA